MVAVLKPGSTEQQVDSLLTWFHSRGLKTHLSVGDFQTIIGLIGDTSQVDVDLLEGLEIIESVKRISEPFKNANRKFHPEDTVVDIGGLKIGGGHFQMIAGPCSVESPEQIRFVAESVKASGAALLRGGAFKPRTSPYSFQGLAEDGLKILADIRAEFGLKIVTEAIDIESVDLVEKYGDVIQIGARNMQNFSLLKHAGKSTKPVLLKRGNSATLEELLMAAEYILAEGNYQVILCERGIRTFADHTRNTLDLSVVPAVQQLSHLPIIVDPSHGTGHRDKVLPLSRAAVAAGADGIIVEVHQKPEEALSDGNQSIMPDQFDRLMQEIRHIAPVLGRTLLS